MGGWRLAVAMCLVLSLAGCGSSSELEIEQGAGLPVACVSRSNPGPCPTHSRKFYYDYAANRCKPVAAGGCAGLNLFDSKAKCVSYCGAQP